MLRVFSAAALLVATAIWLLSGHGSLGIAGQWVITPNFHSWPPGAWLLPLGVVFIFGGAAALSAYDRFKRAKTPKEQKNSTITALVCLAILLFLWPWALLGPGSIPQPVKAGETPKLTLEGRYNIIAALWSDVATEYFGDAYRIEDARQFGHEYAQKWQNPTTPLQAHVATHPPGAVLLFYGTRRLYEALPPLQSLCDGLAVKLTGQELSDITSSANLLRVSGSRGIGAPDPPLLTATAVGGALFAAVLLGISLVAAIPAIYGLATIGSDGPEAEARGLLATALWCLTPTVNLFAFTLDAPIATGVAWSLFFVAKAMHTEGSASRRWMVSAGVLLALTSFLSIGVLAVGAIVIVALVLYRRETLLKSVIELGMAFLATWVLLALLFNFNPLEVVLKAMAAHRFATLGSRSWAPWTVMNLLMWALFLGFPVVLSLFQREKPTLPGLQLGLATLVVVIVLTLSGNVRGEVERLWLFLVPTTIIWAVGSIKNAKVASLFLALQAAQTLLMAATLAPLVRP